MARNKQDKSFNKVMQFFNMRFKMGFNDDESSVSSSGHYTKGYHKGTYQLNKKIDELGAAYSLDLGYDRKKLD